MSKDLNKVLIIGRLGKDPETRTTPQGSQQTSFTVASGRRWRTAEGEDRDDTEWFNVVAWDKLAATCSQYLQKGARVYIEGRLQTRSWEDQATGQKRYMTEVIAHDMIMLESRQSREHAAEDGDGQEVQRPAPQRAAPAPASRGPQVTPAGRPAARTPGRVVQPVAETAGGPPEDDDLPF